MFPVRCELNFYINLLRNSVFKGLIATGMLRDSLIVLGYVVLVIKYSA
jgi:hypothetical protein